MIEPVAVLLFAAVVTVQVNLKISKRYMEELVSSKDDECEGDKDNEK